MGWLHTLVLVLFIFCCLSAEEHAVMVDPGVLREAHTMYKDTLFKHNGGPSSGPKELFFQQTLNHFNYLDNRTWMQRYFLQDGYWNGSGPMFFYTGNIGPIETFMNNSGFIFTLAKEFSALVVFAEHRYYGKSLPFGQGSLAPPNISYLSVAQALADYAVLIQSLKTQYTGILKVIAFGGSYSGMLTTWMRFKYPNLVDGGVASSAPIFNAENIIPRTAFFQKVTDAFAQVDPRCPGYVRDGFNEMFYWSQYGSKGYAVIYSNMNLCDYTWTDDNYLDNLIGWVRTAFVSLTMMNFPYESNSIPAYPVRASCEIMLNEANHLTGLAQAAGVFYNSTGKLSCFNNTKEYVECADPTGCGSGPAAQAWDYQVCTELELELDTNNVTDMFPPSTHNATAYCKKKWGVIFRSDWLKTQFWGNRISSASNIIFSNGNLDPWSIGGVGWCKCKGTQPWSKHLTDKVLWNVSDSLTSIVIEGGTHSFDLRAPDPRDPPSVTEAREVETSIIKQWLGD